MTKRQVLVDLVMALLAVLSLVPILWVELGGVRWPDPRFKRLALLDLGFVLVFLGDFLHKLIRARDRKAFWRAHWYELPGLVPLYFEAFSWLRFAQVFRLSRVLRLLRAVAAWQRMRAIVFLDHLINQSKLGLTLMLSTGVVLTMAAGVWILERDTNPGLSTFGDALWWAIVTVTTVGYGDITPHSGMGRLFATVLMVTGIGLIGVVASTLSTTIIATNAESPRTQETLPVWKGTALVEALERLSVLRERGHLSEEEFQTAKRRLLEEHPASPMG